MCNNLGLILQKTYNGNKILCRVQIQRQRDNIENVHLWRKRGVLWKWSWVLPPSYCQVLRDLGFLVGRVTIEAILQNSVDRIFVFGVVLACYLLCWYCKKLEKNRQNRRVDLRNRGNEVLPSRTAGGVDRLLEALILNYRSR